MNELWKYAIVAFVCLLLGFTAGYLGDFPNQITFDATPELREMADDMKDNLVRLSELSLNQSSEDCPVRLRECELLCN